MRIQFAITRPSAVDRSLHAITQLVSDGYTVGVSVQGVGPAAARLDAAGVEHTVLTRLPTDRSGSVGRLIGGGQLSRYTHRFDPDVIVGESTPTVRTAAAVAGARVVSWPEPTQSTAKAPTGAGLTTDGSYVPAAPPLRGAVARFHPNWFSASPEIRRSHGLDGVDSYAVALFTAKASPFNSPETGLSRRTKQQLVASLSTVGGVYVSNTDDPHPALDAERITVPPHESPHLVDGASLFVTDAAELAVSGGLCGTPTVYAHSTETDAPIPAAGVELAAQKLVSVAVGDSKTQSTVNEMVDNSSREGIWERRAARLFTATGDPTADLLERIIAVTARTRSRNISTASVDDATAGPN